MTSGIYRLTRNPMYLGLLLLLSAWALWLSAWWPLAGPLCFVLYVNRFQIEPEEKILTEKSVSGAGAWSRLYEELIGALRVEVDGEQIDAGVRQTNRRTIDADVPNPAGEVVLDLRVGMGQIDVQLVTTGN